MTLFPSSLLNDPLIQKRVFKMTPRPYLGYARRNISVTSGMACPPPPGVAFNLTCKMIWRLCKLNSDSILRAFIYHIIRWGWNTSKSAHPCLIIMFLFPLQVKVWFQNRRMKWRHCQQQEMKATEEQESAVRPDMSNLYAVDHPVNDPGRKEMEGSEDGPIK